jgi:nicotinamide-nucleotide amidase
MMIQKLAEQLKARRLMLGTAESCTGGLLAATLTEIPGASDWFESALITYSNLAKQSLLNVNAETIRLHGAVSERCAREMLQGLLAQKNISIGVAITGIAGPDGGSAEKPVGTVWFAFGVKGHSPITQLKNFSGDRHSIRQQACQFAIEYLTKMLG